MTPSQMLDARPVHITDFGRRNRDETDVIMTKSRDKSEPGPSRKTHRGVAGGNGVPGRDVMAG